jgi:hypothetical protein
VGDPAAPLYVDVGAAGPSSPSLFAYLVYAENNGGPEAIP